ncbi:hypothetical protein DLJ57_21525 [Micromonospora chalcea]|nr:hypothetical protein DLJ57_21525 [Micromonospora chalcea]
MITLVGAGVGEGCGAVSGDADGVTVGPCAEQHPVDVQACALGKQRGDAGVLPGCGGVGQQQHRRQRLPRGIERPQVGHRVSAAGVDETAAVQDLRFDEVEGLLDGGGDRQTRGVGQGRGVRVEEGRRGCRWHHHLGAFV